MIGSQSIDRDDQEVEISPGRGNSPAVPGKRKDERGQTDARQEKRQPPRCPAFFHGIPEDYVIGKNGLLKGDAEKKGEPGAGSPLFDSCVFIRRKLKIPLHAQPDNPRRQDLGDKMIGAAGLGVPA